MRRDICKYCDKTIAVNQRGAASNHVYKHVRRLRRILEGLSRANDNDLLAAYSELRAAENAFNAPQSKRLRLILQK